MKQAFKSCLKTIPGSQALVRKARMQIRMRAIRKLLKSLHPVSTDKKLIRFGPKGDGGYLIPDDLDGISACFSPGVDLISGFEGDCAERGMKVFLADASVDGPAQQHELFHFQKKYIGGTSRSGFITLDDWTAESLDDKTSDLMLQIDIEGFEYEALRAASDSLLRRYRIIVAEFHGLDDLFTEWSDKHREITDVFNKILRTHSCVHIHPNNCCANTRRDGIEIPRVMEFTFLRKDRIDRSAHATTFPHPLDFDNTPNPPLNLPKCWYHQ